MTNLPAPGLHQRVPFADYLAWPAVNKSTLDDLSRRSPAYVRWCMDQDGKAPTPAQRFGTAVHTAVLEPDLFALLYDPFPLPDLRTRAAREQWAQVEAEGKVPIKQQDYDDVRRIAGAVKRHPDAEHLLNGHLVAHREVSLRWDDKLTGLACKGRADLLVPGVALGDLKVTRYARPDRFEKFLIDYGTHRQAAYYMDGAAELGHAVEAFRVVAVMPDPPHEVAVYELAPEAIEAGRLEIERALRTYKDCMDRGEWPGYGTDVVQIGLPDWYMQRLQPRAALTMGGKRIDW